MFKKNIPFCIYRFPNQSNLKLAVEPSVLSVKSKDTFVIAPFVSSSNAEPIYLSILSDEQQINNLLEHINPLPDFSEPIFEKLPNETTQSNYRNAFNAYQSEIKKGSLYKAILSRVIHEDKPDDFNLFECFENLLEAYPNTFVHLSVHQKSGIWLGATPELLFEKVEDKLSIMSLAGTQAKTNSTNYVWREKELNEHNMVGEHIESIAKKYKLNLVKKDGPLTSEAAFVVHLKTNYTYQETEILPIQDFLNDLHPTPTVGGLPAQNGVACILKNENYDRRYYCGYIGETDFLNYALLFVNLRCMQIADDKIAIFVGGGITNASVVEEEWRETELKSKTMMQIIHSPKKVIAE